ncbi:hypothetical protein BCR33DRAFT_719209 [Rhizoclosmatium globosum]|uniref:Uncharacterized protein n=1 Tax=Rhizoclosmatium globosum TaxID=329046 RepID=A0A1Y2C188_9FUNG|nr:hypothetical protein BCR33DRAFT_719209 [Rhizoclosmatium globosum]|eukprot:ORY40664.1 hypothetical protein BCR33DRAFT_719209 [Rhizoclosmatium globosum]
MGTTKMIVQKPHTPHNLSTMYRCSRSPPHSTVGHIWIKRCHFDDVWIRVAWTAGGLQ